jgi:signal transduction histidine kinase
MELDTKKTQKDKLLMLGGMFENIIHQFKQPLNAINTEATGLKFQKEMGMLSDEEFVESLDNITKSTVFLAETIDDFRDFLKEDKERVYFNIEDSIKKVESVIKPILVAKGIETHKFFAAEHITCNGYSREFAQVIINILNNAKDAILLENRDDKVIKIDVNESDTNITIDIYDNGGGIPDDVLPRIFESHFTTKEATGGTGIGLNMSKTIIEDHFGGSLLAKNTQFDLNEKSYYGACFTIDIPKNI